MNTKLMNGKILVAMEKKDDTTASGIIISTSTKSTGKYTVISSAQWAFQYGVSIEIPLSKGDIITLDPRARLIPADEEQGLYYVDWFDVITVTSGS